MLTPEYLEHCADDVVALYQQLDESIARDIARRLVKMGEITDTARWQAEQLQHAGLLYDEVIAEVAKYSGSSEDAVRTAFEAAGVESVDAEIPLYKAAGLELPPIRQSERAWNLLQAALRKTNGDLRNLTLTTAVEAQQRFIAACTLAETQVSAGMLDYGTAIRRAVQDASRAGASVLYPSGHVDRLDVAVRRAVLTGVNQTCGQISLTLAGEFGCDLMEITAHAGARPSHAVWQGQLVSLSGRRGYLSLSDIGYGTGAGFMGWNCRHAWNPFFEGISRRSWTNEKLGQLNARNIAYDGQKYTEYEISQMQRKMEREIRATKRALAGLDAAEFQAEFTQQSVKLKQQEAQLKAFTRQTGQRVDTLRTQVQGFGRSQTQKAVAQNKRYQNLLGNLESVGIHTVGFNKHPIHPKILSEMEAAYVRLAELYPKEIMGLVLRYGFNADAGTFGWYDPKAGEIVFNRRIFSSLNALEKSYAEGVSVNLFPNNTDWRALFYHEFGHRFSDVNGIDNMAAVKAMEQQLGYGFHTAKKAQSMLEHKLSSYAYETTVPQFQEVIAECFGEWYNSNKPRDFCREYLKEVGAI